MTGQRFGNLTVLYRSKKPAAVVVWTCRCDCGKIVDVAGNNLRRGHTLSCGCRRTQSYIGKRYGKLIVLGKTMESVQHGSTRSPLWRCRCDCGNITLVRMDSLTSGTTQSCGCLTEEKIKKMREAAGYIDGTQFSRIRSVPKTAANASGVVGVYYDRKSGKWDARLTCQGKRHYLGRYNTIAEAAAVRKQAEAEWFGNLIERFKRTHTE